ncbi:CCHC-type domain-containing protein [Citrus sinensis]|nr:CCHC-type domain-containing protein [Citrus sinensis]
MATPKIDLEKFNRKNDFNMWKVKMEALLVTQGLGDAIQPVTKNERKELSSSKTPEHVAEIDRKVRGTIILSLADSVIREVAKEPTVVDLWAKLESIYMKKSLANRLYIKKRMFTLKMVEGISLDDHLDEFNKVYDTLEIIDVALYDEDKALLLISSLPKSYGHFIDALMYGRQTLSLDEVKSALNTKKLQSKQDHLGNESGMLDQMGCSVMIESGELMIVKDSHVVMKGSRKNGVFILDGDVVNGEAGVSSADSIDKIKIWHIREIGLKELAKTSPSSAIDFKRPYEKWTRQPANYGDLKAFGCTAYAHISQGKLVLRALKGIFIGYLEGVKGYKIWCTDVNPPKCIISRDVIFNEKELIKSQAQGYKLARDRAKRQTRPPRRYGYANLITYAVEAAHEINDEEPKTFNKAIRSKFRTKWKEVMDDEILSLHNNETCKLSPRQWYLRFDEFMVTRGFMRCNYDCCVYYKLLKDDLYIYLLLYVDDMLIACKVREEIKDLKKILSSEFDMKNLGITKKILGVEIERNRVAGLMFLLQKKYFTRVLHTYQMLNSKLVQTPLTAHFRFSNLQSLKTSEEKLEMEDVPYANAVGCLMYAIVLTRPDISHVVSVVSRYMAAPGKEHWKAVKWIMRYLSGTLSCGLVYGKNKGSCEGLLGFVDSDYAEDLDRRRSLTGYMFLFNGCLVNWKATLQHGVALSTTKAEYTAATKAVKEALWLQGLTRELGVKQKTITVYCDSSSALHPCRNPAHHKRTKHIDDNSRK